MRKILAKTPFCSNKQTNTLTNKATNRCYISTIIYDNKAVFTGRGHIVIRLAALFECFTLERSFHFKFMPILFCLIKSSKQGVIAENLPMLYCLIKTSVLFNLMCVLSCFRTLAASLVSDFFVCHSNCLNKEYHNWFQIPSSDLRPLFTLPHPLLHCFCVPMCLCVVCMCVHMRGIHYYDYIIYHFWGFNGYIIVDLVKCSVLTLAGEIGIIEMTVI